MTYDAGTVWFHVDFVHGPEEDKEFLDYQLALFCHHAADVVGLCMGQGLC